jgi:LptA/(LptD N-terminal domain) LPS transport protein
MRDYCIGTRCPAGVEEVAERAAGFSQNRDQPVHIEAATLEVRDKDKTATFSGNVRVTQGGHRPALQVAAGILRVVSHMWMSVLGSRALDGSVYSSWSLAFGPSGPGLVASTIRIDVINYDNYNRPYEA